MTTSANARWRGLMIACTLALCACSERNATVDAADNAARRDPSIVAMARGKIEVEGGMVLLSPALAGTVTAIDVREGTPVNRGQLLLTQANEPANAAVSLAHAELKLARAKLRASEQRLPELRRTATRYAEAARAGAAQPQLADEARQRLAEADSSVAVARADVAVAEQRLKQAEVVMTQLALRAPEDGVVATVSAQVGAHLAPGDPALTLLPRRPLIVRAELNAAYVGSVHEGMRATVVSDLDSSTSAAAWPSARLVRISPIYKNGFPQQDPQRGPARVIDCILEFDGDIHALVGQNVRVSFHE